MQNFLVFMELVLFWKCYDITHIKYCKTTSNQFIKNIEDKCKVRPRTGHECPERSG